MTLPRYWKVAIRHITGLQFCDRDCGCGENNQLWWFPPGATTLPEFIRDQPWINGADSNELWQWLVENGHANRPVAGGCHD